MLGHDVPMTVANAAAAALRDRSGVERYDVALVLGSGWREVADALGAPHWEAPVTELPGFPAPTALGHGGTVRAVTRGGLSVLVLLGRVHLYEGHPAATVAHGVRTAMAAGCRTVILTNAAGGITPDLQVGEPVLLADQLNLTGRSPLTADDAGRGAVPRAAVPAGSSGLYDAGLRDLARAVDPTLREGVYAGLTGPHFETPAEIRMLARLGADLVGMSTTLEAIAVRAAGARLLGISLVSNLAAGVSPVPLSADDVIAAGRAALPRLAGLVTGLIDHL